MKRLKRVICYLLIFSLLAGVISLPGYERTVVMAAGTTTDSVVLGQPNKLDEKYNIIWTLTEDTTDGWDLEATPYKLTISLEDPVGDGSFPAG